MEFQVNDETYFLTLAEDQRRWCFSVSTPKGAMVLPVYVDAPDPEPLVMLHEEEKEQAAN